MARGHAQIFSSRAQAGIRHHNRACSNVFAVGGAIIDRGVPANRFHFSFRVNKQLALLRLLLVQVESKFRVADRADPPRYRANFGCRPERTWPRERQAESHYGTNRSIKAQVDSQSGRKSATGRENLKNEQHKGGDEEKGGPGPRRDRVLNRKNITGVRLLGGNWGRRARIQ